MLWVTLALVLTLIALIYWYLTWNFGYWRKRGVQEPKALPAFGSYRSLIKRKRHVAFDLDDIYRAYKRDEHFVGIFNCRTPQLLVTSAELAHKVFVTEFKHFHDNEVSTMMDEKSDFILSHNPFVLAGSVWKERRAELTPALSSSKVKAVYSITRKVCSKLSAYVREQIRPPPKHGIDTKDLCFRFTSEIVSDCVLGMQTECFSPKPSPIMSAMRKIFDRSFTAVVYQIVTGIAPWVRRFHKINLVPKQVEEFCIDLAKRAIDLRLSGDQKLRDRNDFLNYMLQLQGKKQLSGIHLAAHMVTFMLDGIETTSSVIAHCLLLLARDQDRSERLHQEIATYLDSNGEIDFDTLHSMPYLDACIHESIRLFPPGLFSNKICTEPIELMNKNGNALLLQSGQTIVVPLMSIMYDEDIYPHPEEFRPERFLEEPEGLKKFRERGLYYGFGNGPRICIGMRFALTQTKAAIVEILRNFKISVNPKTRQDNRLDPVYMLGRLDGGVWLDFEGKT